jgi:hypothetical protein
MKVLIYKGLKDIEWIREDRKGIEGKYNRL